MNKKYILVAALLGFMAVLLGAFGAHGIKGMVTSDHLSYWKTANEYHFYHTLTILIMGFFYSKSPVLFKYAANFFIIGIILFSGSLYLMTVKDVLSLNTAFLGPITPLGGIFFLSGWFCVFLAALKTKNAGI